MRERVAPETANVLAGIQWARKRQEIELLLPLALAGEVLVLPPAEQLTWLEEVLKHSQGLSPALLARAYRTVGDLQFLLLRLPEARASLLKSASLYKETRQRAGRSDGIDDIRRCAERG